jgi:hypothetical protein
MKAILSTLMVTIMSGVIVIQFFLSNLLSFFGYAVLPLESLKSLTHSKKIVQKMQHRNKAKSANVSKRFIQRSGKKVAVTAVSAATIGTVALIGTLTYLEISQYCEDKQVLNEDANILFDTDKIFDMSACLKQGKQDSAQFANEAWLSIKETSSDVFDSIEQTSDEMLDPSRKATAELFESIDQWFNQTFNSTIE